MSTRLDPKIEMFSPFKEPFKNDTITEEKDIDYRISFLTIVSPDVVGYMVDDTTKIVAKCTPCQCCACR